MLKKTEITKLKNLGIDVTKLEAAFKSDDEHDYVVPDIKALTDEQLAERDTQVIAAAKPDILKEGKKTGIEIANKAIVKKYGLSEVDTADPDKVIAALDAKVAKGDSGLQEQINLLQRDKTALEQAVEAEKNNTKTFKRDAELLSSLPANRTGMSDNEFLALTKMNLEFEELDGKEVVKRNGEVLRDKTTQAPIAKKDAISSLFAEKKWIAADPKGGRGGGDNSGGGGTGGIKKFSVFAYQWKKDNPGKSEISPEFMTAVNTHATATTDFDYNT